MCKKYAKYLVISKNCCTFAADLHKECFFHLETSGLPPETFKTLKTFKTLLTIYSYGKTKRIS